jgi:hypothetical protein
VTVDDVVTACANNAARIEQLAQRLGVGTGRGWYCDTAAIVKCMTGMPREVLVELAEQYGAGGQPADVPSATGSGSILEIALSSSS